jgi:protein-tyrosine phosphatase
MDTTRIRVNETDDYEAAVRDAADRLRSGALVAIPTDTAYAVAASAAHPEAVRRLAELKGVSEAASAAPANSQSPFDASASSSGLTASFGLFVAQAAAAFPFVAPPGKVSRLGRRFLTRGWPGPLTLIFRADPLAPDGGRAAAAASPASEPGEGGGDDADDWLEWSASVRSALAPQAASLLYRDGRISVRCPDQDVALDLLYFAETPVIAVGAGPVGHAPARDPDTAAAAVEGRVELFLDAGECRYARGSTLVAVEGERYEILRPGVVEDRVLKQLSSTLVLFVCTGNSCRSPMAEGLFRKMLADKLGVAEPALAEQGLMVMSAGVYAGPGGPPTEEAVDAAGALGADISRHRSRPLTPELLMAADRVLTMTRSHSEAARRLAPGCSDKIRTLNPDGDVSDPMGYDVDTYRRTAEQIRDLLVPLVEEVAP